MARRHVETKQRVAELIAEGLNHTQIANRIENLAVLCPNCHSQTENFAGRNRRAEAEAA